MKERIEKIQKQINDFLEKLIDREMPQETLKEAGFEEAAKAFSNVASAIDELDSQLEEALGQLEEVGVDF